MKAKNEGVLKSISTEKPTMVEKDDCLFRFTLTQAERDLLVQSVLFRLSTLQDVQLFPETQVDLAELLDQLIK
jgi:hypothetical protein